MELQLESDRLAGTPGPGLFEQLYPPHLNSPLCKMQKTVVISQDYYKKNTNKRI